MSVTSMVSPTEPYTLFVPSSMQLNVMGLRVAAVALGTSGVRRAAAINPRIVISAERRFNEAVPSVMVS
jgi:hypothetical protein